MCICVGVFVRACVCTGGGHMDLRAFNAALFAVATHRTVSITYESTSARRLVGSHSSPLVVPPASLSTSSLSTQSKSTTLRSSAMPSTGTIIAMQSGSATGDVEEFTVDEVCACHVCGHVRPCLAAHSLNTFKYPSCSSLRLFGITAPARIRFD